MQSYTRRVLFGGMLAAIAGAALAQPPMLHGREGPGMMGPVAGGGPAMMGDPAAYLDGLKAQLAITRQQETAWGAYADAVKASTTQMQAMHQSMWPAMETATWQERRDMMNRALEARQEAYTAVHEAATKLDAVLTPGQRTKAATMLPGLRTPGRMGPGRMRGGPPS
ncbi:MAG: Spy/CpxP family protein refolding chaperone [Acetobacteraceae bacterium]|nr:Spy/CpxP family protein refolding chaperone [Acetobacteraceae bacterium]